MKHLQRAFRKFEAFRIVADWRSQRGTGSGSMRSEKEPSVAVKLHTLLVARMQLLGAQFFGVYLCTQWVCGLIMLAFWIEGCGSDLSVSLRT